MLKKFFEDFNETKAIGIFLIIVIIVVILGRGSTYNNSNDVNEEIKVLDLSTLNDNYNLEIVSKIDDKSYSMSYSRDKNVIISSDGSLSYMKYGGNLYCISQSDVSLCDEYKLDKYFDSVFYDIKLISNVYKKSNEVSLNKYSYKLSDYFSEYNSKYNGNFNSDEEEFMEVLCDRRKCKFIIDYSKIYNIIYGKDLNVVYEVSVSNINANNYDDIVKLINND